MYVNFAHFFIPKFCALLSFFINPFTVYIVWNDKKLQLGNYRHLLFFFAIFNIMASLADVLVPWCVLNHRYAFSVFVIDGFFEPYSEFHQFVLAFRCGFISGTYAVLHAHFLYRFLVLFNNQFLNRYFVPHGIVVIVLYTMFHIGFWIVACWYYIGADFDRRQYIREALLEEHGLDSMNITIIVAQYNEGPYESIKKTWIGIGSMSVLSIISLAFIFIFGYQIVSKLRSQNLDMSEKTKKLQTQLIKALIVQAAIPTVVSFSPCLFAWYQPVFKMDLGRWLQHAAGIAVATFPCLDPLALIIFVPTFRRQFREIVLFMVPRKQNQTSCTQSAIHQSTTTQTQSQVDK